MNPNIIGFFGDEILECCIPSNFFTSISTEGITLEKSKYYQQEVMRIIKNKNKFPSIRELGFN